MRVNIIGGAPNTGIAHDMRILHGLIVHALGNDVSVQHVPHFHPSCGEAELNFFIEVINPALFPYAAKNIWIPNPEWTYKTWEPYLYMVDEVWVKTLDAVKIFGDLGIAARYVGWTSADKVFPETKDYTKAIVPIGKNMWRNPKPLIQAYMKIKALKELPGFYEKLPHVTMVYQIKLPDVPESVKDKFTCITERLSDKDYDALLHESGLAICLSVAEGFGHAVNEAMSAGCNLLLSPIEPFRELARDALWVSTTKIIPHPQCLGNLEDVSVESVVESLAMYIASTPEAKVRLTNQNRKQYEDRHALFVETMKEALLRFKDMPEFILQDRLPKEENLPPISVITLTRDRRAFFPLAKYCMVAQTYPEDKIEWVIVDDGKDQIKNLVTDLPNVTYILLDEPLTIGAKRNLAISRAKHDILVMLDDDDVYPNNSLISRVAHMLAEPKKECLFSTVIPCYEIHETKSFMNVPPMTLPMSQRVSEATLCFTRKFWEAREFPDQQIAEADAFIRGREQMCRELSPQDVIVSLIHKKNTSSRKPPVMEANGSHYGFSDELFTLISEIAGSL
jgi:Glycosyl transferase family 2/Glycosyl transferases group 1